MLCCEMARLLPFKSRAWLNMMSLQPGLRRVRAPVMTDTPAFPADRDRLERLLGSCGAAERLAWRQQDSAQCCALAEEIAELQSRLAPFEAAGETVRILEQVKVLILTATWTSPVERDCTSCQAYP